MIFQRRNRSDRRIGLMHIVHSLNVGGAEKLVFELARAADSKRFSVVVACLDEAGEYAPELSASGVKICVLNRKPGVRPELFGRIAALVWSNRIDVVHAHQYTPYFYGLVGARLSGRAHCLLTEHGRFFPDVRKPKRVAVNQILWRLTGATVAVSEFTRQALVDNEGFPADRVEVLYNGIHAHGGVTDGERARLRTWFGVPDDEPDAPVIGTCARLSHEKNLPMMVEAFAALRQHLPSARLIIAGDGPARPKIEQRRDALGLGDAVRLVGFVDNVPQVVGSFDVFAMSSLTEGTSVTLLEAMYAGRPVVATDVGGNPEIVVDGETGLLVRSKDPSAFADALRRVLTDRDEANRLGRNGRARTERHFTFEGMVRAYEEIYVELARRTTLLP